eukprot:2821057-Prymnesium_polylepis.1
MRREFARVPGPRGPVRESVADPSRIRRESVANFRESFANLHELCRGLSRIFRESFANMREYVANHAISAS